ncbi:MAG: hypothetical protein HFJ33_02360 [Clostridia bacterium]|nr:hypothetical protein [Clostridia bacterium]
MASFYNNYYRYYKPYLPIAPKFYPTVDKSLSKPEPSLALQKKEEESSLNSSSPSSTSFRSSSEKTKNKSSHAFSFGPLEFKNPFFNDMEEPIFEIFGIQLYLDDIIIVGLLFFLYQEDVQDEMLYIALILLLLS